MTYDPFARGPFPVGVKTFTLRDPARDGRELPTELWYPATDAHAGKDTAKATRDSYVLVPGLAPSWQLAVRDAPPRDGVFPLIAFSHGFGAHRRQSTFLCTHMASHGYVVVAVDHIGNTTTELIYGAMGGGPRKAAMPLAQLLVHRPADITFAIDQLLAGAVDAVRGRVDANRIGMMGHSFGGWTTLATTARDRRIRAALPLAPAGGKSPLMNSALFDALSFDWGRDVPTLFIVADRDSILPLSSMTSIYDPIGSPKKFVVLKNADHMHFCDAVERVHELFRMLPPMEGVPRAQELPPITQLCPGEHGYSITRALGLAHMDAHLRGDAAARAFLDGSWRDALATRGIAFEAA